MRYLLLKLHREIRVLKLALLLLTLHTTSIVLLLSFLRVLHRLSGICHRLAGHTKLLLLEVVELLCKNFIVSQQYLLENIELIMADLLKDRFKSDAHRLVPEGS